METRALWVCGGIGLFFDLSDQQRLQVVDAFVQANQLYGNKLKIFAGATSETATSTLENIKKMKEMGGVDGIFVAPLYFLSNDDDDEVRSFFKSARKMIGPNYPLILYNNPDFVRAVSFKEEVASKNFQPDVLQELKGTVSAVKDSSCNPTLFQQYTSTGIPVYTGEEGRLIDCLTKYGAHGCVAGLGNISPTCVQITRLLHTTNGNSPPPDDAEKMELLSEKLKKECSAYWGIVHAHPDKKPVVVMAALLLDCLVQAGVLEDGSSTTSMENDFLTEKDRMMMKEAGLIPKTK
eukprot:CAMPEP_0185724962 /NCGR_PEP_ID=MMETSP1171-20130828/1313_1 /TAXON_ID=374046 /ORGANISM="Helicotheca tamensis, Strain CCMP826" /LENGTH=292 /DNA_ID=CAMNT_0028392947 /DNA_START=261 /DNA_END=1139 /DNA_ORIENTATION=+